MQRNMARFMAVALGVVVALSAVFAASAQQEPPHRFYGHGATAGDTIGAHANDEAMTLIASATVDEGGSWFIDVDRDAADDVVFSINGKVAESEVTSTGSGQSSVTLTVAMMEDDSMMEGDDDSMMEDGDSMLDEEDSMMEDDSMMDDDDSMMEDVGMPSTGTGGLADGGVSAGLVGLLIALGAAAIAGLGLRRVRSRS